MKSNRVRRDAHKLTWNRGTNSEKSTHPSTGQERLAGETSELRRSELELWFFTKWTFTATNEWIRLHSSRSDDRQISSYVLTWKWQKPFSLGFHSKIKYHRTTAASENWGNTHKNARPQPATCHAMLETRTKLSTRHTIFAVFQFSFSLFHAFTTHRVEKLCLELEGGEGISENNLMLYSAETNGNGRSLNSKTKSTVFFVSPRTQPNSSVLIFILQYAEFL